MQNKIVIGQENVSVNERLIVVVGKCDVEVSSLNTCMGLSFHPQRMLVLHGTLISHSFHAHFTLISLGNMRIKCSVTINQSINQSVNPSIHQSNNQCLNQSLVCAGNMRIRCSLKASRMCCQRWPMRGGCEGGGTAGGGDS